MRYSAEEAAAIITQESQDNLFDLSDDGDDDFPVGSGSDIESETEEENTESEATDEDELEQNVLELVQYRSGEEDIGQEESSGEASMCLVKDLELNHHRWATWN